jgi:prepilin-type N-terminal cleavage/methylation domain-containing protein
MKRVKSNLKGMTLLELLIVVAILGILGAIGFSTFAREARAAAVRQVAVQLQVDLESLRRAAIQFNGDASLTLNTTGTGYTLEFPTGEVATPTRAVTQDFSVSGVTLTSSAQQVTYSAPDARLGAVSRLFRLSLHDEDFFVKLIGVTGKTVLSATN